MTLTDAELTTMRAEVAQLLPDTCTIQRKSDAIDASGFPSETYSAQVTGAACRFDPYKQSDNRGQVAEREATRTYYQVTLAWNADIQADDRIVYDSNTYEIIQLHARHSWRVSTRAIVGIID